MESSKANTMQCFQKQGACSGNKCMAWIKTNSYEGCIFLKDMGLYDNKEVDNDTPQKPE